MLNAAVEALLHALLVFLLLNNFYPLVYPLSCVSLNSPACHNYYQIYSRLEIQFCISFDWELPGVFVKMMQVNNRGRLDFHLLFRTLSTPTPVMLWKLVYRPGRCHIPDISFSGHIITVTQPWGIIFNALDQVDPIIAIYVITSNLLQQHKVLVWGGNHKVITFFPGVHAGLS